MLELVGQYVQVVVQVVVLELVGQHVQIIVQMVVKDLVKQVVIHQDVLDYVQVAV